MVEARKSRARRRGDSQLRTSRLCRSQRSVEFHRQGLAGQYRDGEALGIYVVIHAAGRQFDKLRPGLQNNVVNLKANQMWAKNHQATPDAIAETGEQSLQGRQRLSYGGACISTVGKERTRSMPGARPEHVDGGEQFFVRSPWAVCGEEDVRRPPMPRPVPEPAQQTRRGVPEQVTGCDGQDMDAHGRATPGRGAQRFGKNPARKIVKAGRPENRRLHLLAIRPVGDFDRAPKPPAGYPEGNPETAVGSRRRDEAAGGPATWAAVPRAGQYRPLAHQAATQAKVTIRRATREGVGEGCHARAPSPVRSCSDNRRALTSRGWRAAPIRGRPCLLPAGGGWPPG